MEPIGSLARNMVRTMLIGKRVSLVRTTDPYTNLVSGDEGTVVLVDDMGTIHVRWDNGSNLGLVPGEDAWRVVQ